MRLQGVPSNIAILNGPLVLGYLFSVGLFGVLFVQTILYYLHFPRDRQWLKLLVFGLFLTELVITAFSIDAAWIHFASGWGDLDTLASTPWSFNAMLPLTGFVSTVVHVFFCWRIRALGHFSWILPLLILALSLLQWAFSFCTGITLAMDGIVAGIATHNSILKYAIIWLAGSALCDVIITITMLHFLFRANSRENFKETKSILLKLIMITIGSGMLTASSALTELIMYLASPDTNLHGLMFLMLSKVYSNTLLTTLNARKFINNTESSSGPIEKVTMLWEDQPLTEFSRSTRMQSTRAQRSVHPVVHVTRSTTVQSSDLQEMDVFKKRDLTGFASNEALDKHENDGRSSRTQV